MADGPWAVRAVIKMAPMPCSAREERIAARCTAALRWADHGAADRGLVASREAAAARGRKEGQRMSGADLAAVTGELKAALARRGVAFEARTVVGDELVGFSVQTGFLCRTTVVESAGLTQPQLAWLKQLRRRLPWWHRRRLLVIVGGLDDYWADIAALFPAENPAISFLWLDRPALIGDVPRPMMEALSEVSRSLTGRGPTRHSAAAVPAAPPQAGEDDHARWIGQTREAFLKYAVAVGGNVRRPREPANPPVDMVDESGFVFVPEVQEELVDAARDALGGEEPLATVSLVGVTAQVGSLERAGEGVAVYALHGKYRWRSGARGDRSPTFERFLGRRLGIALVNHKRPGTPLYVMPAAALFLAALVVAAGIYLLCPGSEAAGLAVPAAAALALGPLAGCALGVGRREYPPAGVCGALAGAGVAAMASLAATRGWLYAVDPACRPLQGVLIADLGVAGAIVYAALTRRPPSYVDRLPAELQRKHVGADAAKIRTALNCWDRGWARTVPRFGDRVSITRAVVLEGYASWLDTLFEHRWVTQGECSSSSGSHRSMEAAALALAPKMADVDINRWTYHFADTPRFDSFGASNHMTHLGETCQCPTCGGSGKVTCWSCSGSGRVNCSSCGGSGTTPVYETEWYDEQYTDSEGKWQTRHVSRSVPRQRTCTGCSGSGKVTCTTCGGSGKVTCSRCSGTGSLLIYPVLHCKRDHKQRRSCVDPTAEGALRKVIHRARDRVVLETPIVEGTLAVSTYLTPTVPTVAANLALDEAAAVEAKESSRTHILRQRLRVGHVPVAQVDYTYRAREHRLWVFGYDNRVHALKPPANAARLVASGALLAAIAFANVGPLFAADAFGMQTWLLQQIGGTFP